MNRIAQKYSSNERRINEIPLNVKWNERKIKCMFPDFSGKYHGKLNDKISRKTAEKISKNATAGKKALTENYQSLKGRHNGK